MCVFKCDYLNTQSVEKSSDSAKTILNHAFTHDNV